MFCVKNFRTGARYVPRTNAEGSLTPEARELVEMIAADNKLYRHEQAARREPLASGTRAKQGQQCE
jgi:hypothetical protein